MKRLALMTAAGIVAVVVNARADHHIWITAQSGEQLYDFCSSEDSSPKETYCIGFIAGAASATSAIYGGNMQRIGCYFDIPEGVPLGQLVEIVKKGLADHPEERHESALWLTTKYLRDAYPCK